MNKRSCQCQHAIVIAMGKIASGLQHVSIHPRIHPSISRSATPSATRMARYYDSMRTIVGFQEKRKFTALRSPAP